MKYMTGPWFLKGQKREEEYAQYFISAPGAYGDRHHTTAFQPDKNGSTNY
ncbi:MAG: hypothetical protein IPJ75_04195 [Ignavibacteriales bacterium]|nr:hypothetical protein [Ignavibacteriales bacterium]